jgi:hypothetical protein
VYRAEHLAAEVEGGCRRGCDRGRKTLIGKPAIVLLLPAITAHNTASAVMLDSHILTGKVSNDPAVLLGGGAAIFITNVIVFGIWYWELGRGGPIAHCEMKRIHRTSCSLRWRIVKSSRRIGFPGSSTTGT